MQIKPKSKKTVPLQALIEPELSKRFRKKWKRDGFRFESDAVRALVEGYCDSSRQKCDICDGPLSHDGDCRSRIAHLYGE